MVSFSIFHFFSPLFYFLFVYSFSLIPIDILTIISSCPSLIRIRKIYNISLSVLSFFMMLGISISAVESNKLFSFHDMVCKPFTPSFTLSLSTQIFLYSKYVEWIDSFFLHVAGKKISALQYYHHMSTGFLFYLNIENDYISPYVLIGMFLNSFIHIFMYWYFAFPKGILLQHRRKITQFQIFQHISCFVSILYAMSHAQNCVQNSLSNVVGLFLYSFYLLSFGHFYLNKYIHPSNENNITTDSKKLSSKTC